MPNPQLLSIPMPDRGIDLNRPAPFINRTSASYARNTRYDYGYIGPRMGSRQMGVGSGTTMPFTGEIVLHFATFYDLNGTNYFICITDTGIYKYDSGNDKWDALNVHAGAALTITDISAANPAVVTSTAHGLSNDDYVYIYDVTGNMGDDILNGNVYVVANKTDNTFELAGCNTTGKTYTSGGKAVPEGDLNGSATAHVSTCHMAHDGTAAYAADYYLIICNGVDPVFCWKGGTARVVPIYDTDGSTHTAQQVLSYKESLLLLGADAEPHKIAWSNTGTINVFDFTTTNAGFTYLYDTPGEIMWGGLLGDYIGIAKDDSLGLLSYTGGTDLFRYDTMVRGSGLIAPGALAILKDRWLLITKENVEQWDGGRSTTFMGDRIASDLFDISTGINWSAKLAARVMVDKQNTRASFYIPTGSDSYAGKTFCYNWKENVWEIDELAMSVTGLGSYASFTAYFWASYSSLIDWDDMNPTTWEELSSYEGANVPVIGDENGYIYQQSYTIKNDGITAIDQDHHTPDFVPDDKEYQNRWIRYLSFEFEAKGNAVTISYSTDGGDTWTSIGEQALTDSWTRYKLDFSTTARKIRFRLRNNTQGEQYYVRWMGTRVMPRGRRG